MSNRSVLLQAYTKAEFVEEQLSEKKRIWGDRKFPDDIYLMIMQVNAYGGYRNFREKELLKKLTALSERIQEVMDIWAGNNLA